MNIIRVPTTQNIELEYPVANLGERIGAALLDLAFVLVYWIAWTYLINLYYIGSFWNDAFSDSESAAVLQLIAALIFLPAIFYSLLCESLLNGQTFGKKLMRLQTVRTDGAAPSISQYMIRWILRSIDVWVLGIAPGIVGIVVMSLNKKGQRLGDLAAGTTVVKLKLVSSFMDTMYVETQEGYQVVFPQISKLSDRDVSILKEVLDAGLKSNNYALLEKLAGKVREVAGIESPLPPRPFLETVLKDYNYYYGKN